MVAGQARPHDGRQLRRLTLSKQPPHHDPGHLLIIKRYGDAAAAEAQRGVGRARYVVANAAVSSMPTGSAWFTSPGFIAAGRHARR
jgi:hypothetical protein